MNRNITSKGNYLWYNIKKWKGYTKTNASVKHTLCDWIIHNPQVVHPLLSNELVKVYICGNTDRQVLYNM